GAVTILFQNLATGQQLRQFGVAHGAHGAHAGCPWWTASGERRRLRALTALATLSCRWAGLMVPTMALLTPGCAKIKSILAATGSLLSQPRSRCSSRRRAS